jgi:large conductance mechanosensitive channel
MLKGFREFILRGNVIDLAVAVVIGAAFGAIVAAFSKDVIGGLLGAIGGVPDFSRVGFTLNGSRVVLGTTIDAIISFLIVAAVIYLVIVVPVNRLAERRRRGEPVKEEAPPSDEAVLLAEIRDLLAARSVR